MTQPPRFRLSKQKIEEACELFWPPPLSALSPRDGHGTDPQDDEWEDEEESEDEE